MLAASDKITPSPREALFPAYEKAINAIQDYFEYANQSKTDRTYVKEVMNTLHEECVRIKENTV